MRVPGSPPTLTPEAHQRGEQPSAALDLRMHCLHRRRIELEALVEVLAAADAPTVTNSVQAVHGLPSLVVCADPVLLSEPRRLDVPEDPTTAAAVEALRGCLAQVESQMLAGQYERGLALSGQLLVQAEALAFLPVLAEARFRRGRLLVELGRSSEAVPVLRRAYLDAVQAGHEELQAHALIAEVFALGYGSGDFERAQDRFEAAALLARLAPESSLERGGDPPSSPARPPRPAGPCPLRTRPRPVAAGPRRTRARPGSGPRGCQRRGRSRSQPRRVTPRTNSIARKISRSCSPTS